MRPGMLLKANQHLMGWIGGTMLYEWNEDSPQSTRCAGCSDQRPRMRDQKLFEFGSGSSVVLDKAW